jgi:hypothetical protein
MVAQTFWGLNNTDWTAIMAIATALLVAATFFVGGVAWYQISAAREESAKNRTIMACEKYDTDPILDRCCQVLKECKDNGTVETNPQACRLEMFSVLNYLEGIAIGVEDGFYVNEIARAYMHPIFKTYIKEYIDSGLADRADPSLVQDSYDRLVAVSKKWDTEMTKPKI